jgi:hypothetical protein
MVCTESRTAPRFIDGAETEVAVSATQTTAARIMDVSSDGMRLFSKNPLPLGRRVPCRVDFVGESMSLGMRIVWQRPVAGGWEQGARYVPIVPRTEYLLDNYMHRVLNRTARIA